MSADVALKVRRRLLFRALQSAAKSADGGISALAVAMGRNERVIADAINPDCLEKTPSLDVFLQLFELLADDVVANILLDGTGFHATRKATVNLSVNVFEHYLLTTQRTADASKSGAEALADGVISENERMQWLDLLHAQQNAIADLIAVVRGA